MKVISYKQLPTKLPLPMTLSSIALLKVYEAPDLVWGIVVTLLTLLWIAGSVQLFKEKQVEVEL